VKGTEAERERERHGEGTGRPEWWQAGEGVIDEAHRELLVEVARDRILELPRRQPVRHLRNSMPTKPRS
jgi:hypothetical protein